MGKTRWIVLLSLVLPASAPAHAADELFVSLSFEEACARAKKEDKYVFLDFYTEWCAPCKIMDKTTFVDERVVKLLEEKTIPLKIDADKNEALAKRFRVISFPTLIYAKADGTEMGRISGFPGTDAYLDETRNILSGKDAMARAREMLDEGGEKSPSARLNYGRRLMSMGAYDKALEAFVWCWDEGLAHDPAFYGVRLSFLLADWAQLAREYEPAKQAMIERRNAARKLVIEDDLKGDIRPALEYTRLNEQMGEQADTLALYEELSKEHEAWAQLAPLQESVLDFLLEAKRYQEIDAQMDVLAKVRRQIESWQSQEEIEIDGMPAAYQERLRQNRLQRRLYDVVRYYQVLIGVEKFEEAQRAAELILTIDDSADTYNALAWQGYLTGSPTEANLEQARKADELSNGQDGAVIDTLARIMRKRNQRNEACALLRERVMGAVVTENSHVLEKTIFDLVCRMEE